MTLGMERGMLASIYTLHGHKLCFAGAICDRGHYMNSPSLPASRTMILARVFQTLVICLAIGLFIVNVPLKYEQSSVICEIEPCPSNQLSIRSLQALETVGMTLSELVTLLIAIDILIALVFTTCAIVIFIRKPNDPFTIFVTIMLVAFGTATFTGGLSGIAVAYPQFRWLTQTISMIGSVAILVFFYVFPNGRFVPRWTFAVFVGWFLYQLPRYYLPNSALPLYGNPLIYNLLFLGFFLSGVAAQIYRYTRISNVIERLQTKWVMYGMTTGMGCYLAIRMLSLLVTDPNGSGLLISLGIVITATFFILLIPLSITVAVIRYRLWDINPIINRTLVYGALSFLTIAFYVLTVGGFALYFKNNETNIVISFLATGVVAILFEPLRQRLQRGVNRLMYGERDDPATVLTRLSQRLDSALVPDSVLQTIVETLAQTLRLPYAAIALSEEEPRFASSRELPPSELVHLPLTYHAERVGELILAPRAVGEAFSPADMKLINLIAQQAGVAAYTVRLNKDLQRSRERLVTAQEEERRRLRRDLHDGVGPTLASLSQRIDTASDLVTSDPEKSVQLLKDLKGQVKETVADIRRLVYALRPPVLDEFGLVSAIREHLAQYSGPNGMNIIIDAPDPLPALPAAVEVAAYRIVLESFTNVVKHAKASACQIRFRIDEQCLFLEILDNGIGLPIDKRNGVGFASMRERAAELGGECILENNPDGGTCVIARLPLGKDVPHVD